MLKLKDTTLSRKQVEMLVQGGRVFVKALKPKALPTFKRETKVSEVSVETPTELFHGDLLCLVGDRFEFRVLIEPPTANSDLKRQAPLSDFFGSKPKKQAKSPPEINTSTSTSSSSNTASMDTTSTEEASLSSLPSISEISLSPAAAGGTLPIYSAPTDKPQSRGMGVLYDYVKRPLPLHLHSRVIFQDETMLVMYDGYPKASHIFFSYKKDRSYERV